MLGIYLIIDFWNLIILDFFGVAGGDRTLDLQGHNLTP